MQTRMLPLLLSAAFLPLLAASGGSARAGAILQVSASVSPGNGALSGGYGGMVYSTSSGPSPPSVVIFSPADTAYSYSSTALAGQDPSFAEFDINQTAFGGRSASAYAEVDLADGVWRQLMTASNPGGGGGSAVSHVQISEELTFHVDNATSTTVTPIDVGLFIHGSFMNLGSDAIGEIDLPGFDFEGLVSGNTDGNVVYDTNSRDGITALSSSSAWQSVDFTGTDSLDLVFHGVYPLIGPNEVVLVSINTIGSISQSGSSDYSHTLGISLDLPRGVTFTSTDGFLSAPASAPEPGGLALTLSGLALLAAARRRRSDRDYPMDTES